MHETAIGMGRRAEKGLNSELVVEAAACLSFVELSWIPLYCARRHALSNADWAAKAVTNITGSEMLKSGRLGPRGLLFFAVLGWDAVALSMVRNLGDLHVAPLRNDLRACDVCVRVDAG